MQNGYKPFNVRTSRRDKPLFMVFALIGVFFWRAAVPIPFSSLIRLVRVYTALIAAAKDSPARIFCRPTFSCCDSDRTFFLPSAGRKDELSAREARRECVP